MSDHIPDKEYYDFKAKIAYANGQTDRDDAKKLLLQIKGELLMKYGKDNLDAYKLMKLFKYTV